MEDEAMFEMAETGERFHLCEMTMANESDAAVLEWLRSAAVGETVNFGGGASGDLIVTRVS